MPLVAGPCKTAILQGQILAMHSSVVVGLEAIGVIQKSPTTGIETPKRERNGRQVLRSDEYTKMLSLAGANPRDYAILQVFLQTGIRVSELANLTRDDIDFVKPSITVRGKGMKEREIFLEKKGVHALKSYLAVRGESFSKRVFLGVCSGCVR